MKSSFSLILNDVCLQNTKLQSWAKPVEKKWRIGPSTTPHLPTQCCFEGQSVTITKRFLPKRPKNNDKAEDD